MDTENLKAFVAVAESGSFSVAAQGLFITQPAVSKRIAALEQKLDHALFDRLGKRAALTEAGQLLLPKARHILLSVSEAERSIQTLSGEFTGTLKVATSHHIGLHHLPPVLREFAANYPKVNLQFTFLDSEKAYDKVQYGECELAVVTLSHTHDTSLKIKKLWRDPLVFVSTAKHALSEKKQVTLERLSTEAAILPSLDTITGRLIKDAFDRHHLPLRLNMATNYLETIKMMVSVGLGWSALPRTLVDKQLSILPVTECTLARELGMVTHKKRTLSNAATAFSKLLLEHFKSQSS